MIALDHFRVDLREGYKKHNPIPLHEQFRSQLLAIYDDLFNSFCPQTIEEYAAFLAASITGLTRFTRRVNPALLQQPAADHLFTIPHAAIRLSLIPKPMPTCLANLRALLCEPITIRADY